MTDPDALLQQILDDTLTWEKAVPFSRAEHEAAERISSAFAALDVHLNTGGQLPRAWSRARHPGGGGSGGTHGGPPASGSAGGAGGGGGGRAWDYDQDGEPQGPATGTGNLMGSQLDGGQSRDLPERRRRLLGRW